MENVIIIENILREEKGLSAHQLQKLYRLTFDFSLQQELKREEIRQD
jgi:hypothetical protein